MTSHFPPLPPTRGQDANEEVVVGVPSADAPPPGLHAEGPSQCWSEDRLCDNDGFELQFLGLFWPDKFPRDPRWGIEWPQVEEIRDSVTAVCSFFAEKHEKREKQRRNDAWKRRRLLVLFTCTLQGEHATKRKKTELTGLGALVHRMMGGEPQLWRDVVAFM